jgi:hypothetical protein
VQSLEKEFYLNTPNFFNHAFTHMSDEQMNTFIWHKHVPLICKCDEGVKFG